MNKEGFTLTELLAVIAIISIISLIAIPNITNITENIRKENMLDDAKKFISLAKLKVNSDYSIRIDGNKEFSISELNSNGDFNLKDGQIVDVDGETYSSNSYVRYTLSNDEVTYCIYLNGSKRHIGSISSCVIESDLISKDVVVTN